MKITNSTIRRRMSLSALMISVAWFPTISHGGNDHQPAGAIEALAPSITINDRLKSQTLLAIEEYETAPLYSQSGMGIDDPVDVYAVEKKSPRRAFLQSFLIPGWGQWYTGSRWKPFLFLGLEAAGWYGVNKFHSNGNDAEAEYKAFADDFWNDSSYRYGLKEVFYPNQPAVDPEDFAIDTVTYSYIDDLDSVRSRTFSHHAFIKTDGSEVPEDEYYENIGKYNQFNFGWDDYPGIGDDGFPSGPQDTTNLNFASEHRKEYLQMRDDANREFKRASTMLVAVIGNHLISGIEAALSARRFNRTSDQFGKIETKMRFAKSPTTGKLYPKFTLGYRF